MARKHLYLAPLASVLAFWYLSRSWEHHSLPERPRLSAILLLLLSSGFCFASIFALKWFPNVEDRFSSTAARTRSEILSSGEGAPSRQDPNAFTPSKPVQWTLPVLITLIAFRLEIFQTVQSQRQCGTNGIEFYLCALLIGYQLFVSGEKDSQKVEQNDDPWRSMFDDFYDWLNGRRIRLLISLLTAFGFARTVVAINSQPPTSTYMCFSLTDSSSTIASLQVVGVALDAAIVVMTWQILAWATFLKSRLRALAAIFSLSAFGTLLIGTIKRVFTGAGPGSGPLSWLYGFDVFIDSVTLSILAISLTIWVCEASPVTAATTISMLAAIWQAAANIWTLGNWMILGNAHQLLLFWLVSFASLIMVYALDMRNIVVLRRGGFASILFVLLIAALVVTNRHSAPKFLGRHPINDLVYKARTDHERWLTRASTSNNLETAVRVYQELHNGRKPPPNFDKWYDFAKGSPIVDYFEQIDKDLDPYRAVNPAALRQSVHEMLRQPGVARLTIKSGEVILKDIGDDVRDEALLNLGEMVKKFAYDLPDMVLPINLGPAPRVLPEWEARSKSAKATNFGVLGSAIRGRQGASLTTPETIRNQQQEDTQTQTWQPTTAAELRGMLRQACSPRSPVRANPYWNTGEFCWDCIKHYSNGQFMADWHSSLDTCSQPDIQFLHAFWMTNPRMRPTQKLLPLFSAAKTEHFADIIIPLPRTIDKAPDVPGEQAAKNPMLFWRGSVGEHLITKEALHGSHKFRLANVANKPSLESEVTVLKYRGEEGPEKKKKGVWEFEQLPTQKASSQLPLNIGIGSYAACLSGNCNLAKQAFGDFGQGNDSDMALANKHVLLIDGDDGPDRTILRTLRSQSLPYMATVFRTWYSERLRPWLHFVPIDLRYHGLHSTVAYFVDPDHSKGDSVGGKDADWIASQGNKWARDALGERDMEIYVFRLLLEWARLLDDGRDNIGFEGA